MAKKKKKFIDIVKDSIRTYKELVMCPDDWTLEFVIGHLLIWSVLPELPFYIIFASSYDIFGLLVTYMLSLMPITVTILIIIGRRH